MSAAAARLVPPLDTDADADTDTSTNRYSMFDQLDNIVISSPELSLAPSGLQPNDTRLNDETIRRLSNSLQQLVCQKHGLHQLPEMPIPTYDNGNIDLAAVTSAVQHAASAPSNPAIVVSRPHPRPRSISDISSDLDDPTDAISFGQSSHLLAHIDSPASSAYGSLRRDYPDSSSSSLPRSRPVSMYSSSTARGVTSRPRPDTAGSQSTQSRFHKKATSYSEQRYSPTRLQESSNQQQQQQQQPSLAHHDSPKHQTHRRFRLMPSFKNLHAQAKSHTKRLTIEERPYTHNKPKLESTQLIDIHAALRGLSPLHDPDHDQKFTLECQEMLHPKPNSHQPSRKASIPNPDVISQDMDTLVFRHTATVSEALTVDTNILNWEWPQPPNTYPVPPTEEHQQQQQPPPQNENRKYAMAPSPPPTYPLPPVPSAATSPRKQPSKRSLANPITSAAVGLSFKKYNFSNATKSQSKTNNRINALATNRGVSLDAGLNRDVSNACEMAVNPVTDPLPSPLNARFNQSSRNSKVRELKKRHLSLLVKDTPVYEETKDKPQDGAEPGQASSEAPISIYSSRTTSIPRKPVFSDQHKPLPLTPGSARYRGSGESVIGVTKANIGKSRHARNASTRSRRSSRQVTESEQNSILAHSGVMVMVDSSPRQSRDFRAGAIRISGTPRRKVSIGKAQILPPLRYQPSPRQQLQPRKLSSPPVIDRKRSNTSSIVSKIEIAPHQVSNDLAMTFTELQSSSGRQSPSKASSILEPSPFNETLCRQDSRQCQALSEHTPTPVRYVKDRQYVPLKNFVSAPCTPPTSQDRSMSSCSTSRRREIEHLTKEINRMVCGHPGTEARKDPGSELKIPSAQRPRGDRKSKLRARSSSKTSSSSKLSTNELLARIEADLVKASMLTESSLPIPSKRVGRHIVTNQHEDSDMSITPKSSFQSTSSENSKMERRKNSDASMTDPNEYDGVTCCPTVSNRLVLIPTPSRQRAVDTTVMKSKKRYSNMPAWTTHGKADNASDVVRDTPYTFRKHEQHSLFPPKQAVGNANASVESGPPDSDIELNHFLTEADQMDSAIDSFVESTSSSGSCQSQSRPISPSGSGHTATSKRQARLRRLLSRDKQRHSATSTISNIVDLQRIQDQINSASHDHGSSCQHGLCLDNEAFGRISLVARPGMT